MVADHNRASRGQPLSPAYTEFNYRPLTDAANPSAIRAFRQWARATKQPWIPNRRETAGALIGLVICLMLMGAVYGANFSGSERPWSEARATASIIGFVVPMVLALLIWAVATAESRIRKGTGGHWEHWYRLHHLAEANRMLWHPRVDRPQYPGSLFQIGRNRHAYDCLSTVDGRYMAIGNYNYTTSHGRSARTHRSGFMALKLDYRYPRFVVDALVNNPIMRSNVPQLDKNERVPLHGSFDETFTLYCKAENANMARAVFTPQFMAMLGEGKNSLDAELVDDWLFIYLRKGLDTDSPQVWNRMLQIAAWFVNSTNNRGSIGPGEARG